MLNYSKLISDVSKANVNYALNRTNKDDWRLNKTDNYKGFSLLNPSVSALYFVPECVFHFSQDNFENGFNPCKIDISENVRDSIPCEIAYNKEIDGHKLTIFCVGNEKFAVQTDLLKYIDIKNSFFFCSRFERTSRDGTVVSFQLYVCSDKYSPSDTVNAFILPFKVKKGVEL